MVRAKNNKHKKKNQNELISEFAEFVPRTFADADKTLERGTKRYYAKANAPSIKSVMVRILGRKCHALGVWHQNYRLSFHQ